MIPPLVFYASSRHWADPSVCAWWIHCCHSSSLGAHHRTASPNLFRPMKMNSPLPCFTWHVNGTWSVPVCSSSVVSIKLLDSTSLSSVKSSSTPSIPFHFDGMAMRRFNGLVLFRLFGVVKDRGRPTDSKTVDAWRMTRVARTLSSVRSNWASLDTDEMKPLATKSLLQNISNDSLTLQGRHSAYRNKKEKKSLEIRRKKRNRLSATVQSRDILYLAMDRVTDHLLPRPVGDRNRTRPFPFAEDPTRHRLNPIREKEPLDPCDCRNNGVCHPAAIKSTRCAAISTSGVVPRKY